MVLSLHGQNYVLIETSHKYVTIRAKSETNRPLATLVVGEFSRVLHFIAIMEFKMIHDPTENH